MKTNNLYYSVLENSKLIEINGGWSWSGAMGGCGAMTYEAVKYAGMGIHYLPPNYKALYLASACAAGGLIGGVAVGRP